MLPCGGSQDLVSLVPMLNAEDSFCFSGGGGLDGFCLVCFLLFCYFFSSFISPPTSPIFDNPHQAKTSF